MIVRMKSSGRAGDAYARSQTETRVYWPDTGQTEWIATRELDGYTSGHWHDLTDALESGQITLFRHKERTRNLADSP